ncbi:Ig-like domain-containing protein, partial [Patescibacteria group bacterium]|nr:Ig-like domain-containing protein [Patescibacteria group bacterium]
AGAMDAQDDTNNNITVTVTDNAGNQTITAGTNNYTADTNLPTVTAANIGVTGATGNLGAFKNGDTPVPTWDVTTEGEADTLAAVLFNAASFRAADTALAGALGGGVYTATLAGAMDSQEDANNNVVVTVTDNAGNQTITAGTANYYIDTVLPIIAIVSEFDVNGDGSIDEVMLTNTEPIKDSTVTATNFTIGGTAADTVMATTSTNGSDTNVANDNEITIKIAAGVSGTEQKAVVYAGTLTDSVGNTMANQTVVAGSVVDSANPVALVWLYYDAGTDGSVETIEIQYSEDVTWNGNDLNQFSVTANSLTGLGAVPLSMSQPSGSILHILPTATSGVTGVGVAGTQPSVSYTQSGTGANRIQDASGNYMANATSSLLDYASPLLLSTTPANGATRVAIAQTVAWTFSEPMVTTMTYGTQFTSSINPGGWSDAWSNGNKTVTMSHTDFNFNQSYTITTDTGENIPTADSGVNTSMQTDAIPSTWSFTTLAGGASGGVVLANNPISGSFTINSGAAETSSGTVSLNISTSGASQMLIANDPNYLNSEWESVKSTKIWDLTSGLGSKTVYILFRNEFASTSTVNQSIKVVEVMLATIDVDASILSTNKTILLADNTDSALITVTVKKPDGTLATGKTVTLSSSRTAEDTVTAVNAITDASGIAKFNITSEYAGISNIIAEAEGYTITKTVSLQFSAPATLPEEKPKELEEVVEIKIGDLIKSDASNAVYYFGADGKRHSFVTSTIYYSYYTDFSTVKTISATQLAGIALGSNAKVRPGTWLVKIQTDPKVYAVTPNGILRWVTTEEIAKALYGDTWNKKIIDIDAGFFQDYAKGTSITEKSHPTGALVKYTGEATNYYISNGMKRQISDPTAFSVNLFQNKFVQVISPAISYDSGSSIISKEAEIAAAVY